MRKLGLIGGMSWLSTRTYFEEINRAVQARTSAKSSAPLLIENLDFAPLYRLEKREDWDRAGEVLAASAQRLAAAGAGAVMIAANSMHRAYAQVADAVDVPVIHIADCVGEKMAADGAKCAALLGSRNVMTESFFRQRLVAHGIDLLPPNMEDVEELDHIIYDELMLGKATRDAQRDLKSMITIKEKEGAEAIVLACTELQMVVDIDANVLPIYDSAGIHADKAVEWILGSD